MVEYHTVTVPLCLELRPGGKIDDLAKPFSSQDFKRILNKLKFRFERDEDPLSEDISIAPDHTFSIKAIKVISLICCTAGCLNFGFRLSCFASEEN